LQIKDADKRRRWKAWQRKKLRERGTWSFETITLSSLFQTAAAAEQEEGKEEGNEEGKEKEEDSLPLVKDFFISKSLNEILRRAEARVMLIRSTVHRFERDARQEYRKSHRPLFLCAQCDESFDSAASLALHVKQSRELHKDLFHEIVQEALRFQHIDTIFSSEQGRRLRANRLLFCAELQSMDARIQSAIAQPFRPHIAELITAANTLSKERRDGDGEGEERLGRRSAQLLNGMMVQGIDATSGLRAAPRSVGLRRQHLAPVYQKPNTNQSSAVLAMAALSGKNNTLRDVLRDLRRWRELVQEPIDTVFVPEGSLSVMVCFEWSGFAKGQSFIIGEVAASLSFLHPLPPSLFSSLSSFHVYLTTNPLLPLHSLFHLPSVQ
jgi:hypothetical protein